MSNVPPKERKEWADLLTGKLNVKLKNFFFQMKLTEAKNKLKANQISLDDAIEDIYELCDKYYLAYNMPEDLKEIFKVEIDPKTRKVIF